MMIQRCALLLFMSLSWAGTASAADKNAGETAFKQRCQMCHTVKPGAKAGLGPNLHGLDGTVSGEGNYKFSTALKAAKIKWTATSLDKFLTAPSKVVPGTRMITAVPDPTMRANIVAYLMSLK